MSLVLPLSRSLSVLLANGFYQEALFLLNEDFTPTLSQLLVALECSLYSFVLVFLHQFLPLVSPVPRKEREHFTHSLIRLLSQQSESLEVVVLVMTQFADCFSPRKV